VADWFWPETAFYDVSILRRRLDISALSRVKTYPYTDISDKETRDLYRQYRDTITDRDGLAEALNLSPNRVSELTIRGQLVAANKNPLRYAVDHNLSCYANYKWAINKEFFSLLINLPSDDSETAELVPR
jgi:hypothetical protein